MAKLWAEEREEGQAGGSRWDGAGAEDQRRKEKQDSGTDNLTTDETNVLNALTRKSKSTEGYLVAQIHWELVPLELMEESGDMWQKDCGSFTVVNELVEEQVFARCQEGKPRLQCCCAV